MLKYILLDLDGTMLPINQDEFIKSYFTELCNRFCPVFKIEDERLIKAVWKSTTAMVKNDGSEPNIKVFWKKFASILGKGVLNYVKDFDDFYKNEFLETKKTSGYNPNMPEAVKTLRRKGYTLVAATTPLFPESAIMSRLKWAGMRKEDFALVTTYENSCSAKPNPVYYKEILKKLKAEPGECMMVGNDVSEDMLPAKALGLKTYLVTDCLINRDDRDYSEFKSGTARDFLTFARTMPDAKK